MNAQKANNTIDKARQLQRKLYLSAKANRKRRFHALYDKIYRMDILKAAWKQVKANKGIAGIDDVYIETVIAYGEERLLEEISQELFQCKYRPTPVKRVYIPKKDGSKRALGIPIIKDRIVQAATKIIIEPIFEANFKDNSFGFRPRRNAHQALEEIRNICNKEGWWVLDADIKSYFDNINHEKLMLLVGQKISDRRVLKLIQQWLKAGVMECGRYSESKQGSPQGGVISPLLSNIYLDYLDTVWDRYHSHLGKMIRYADDFVIITKIKSQVEESKRVISNTLEKLELKLHEDKTRIVNLVNNGDGFDFLGFHHRRGIDTGNGGKRYITIIQKPSKKAMIKMRESLKKAIGTRGNLSMGVKELVTILNRKLRGFRNYYALKHARKYLAAIDLYITERLTAWYNKKCRRQYTRRDIAGTEKWLKLMGLVKLNY